jgi:lipoprotein-anchoring transpeptidase ErfK/SrfK
VNSRRTASIIHTVAAGESLADIAEEYGTTVRDLMRANGLPNENFIHPGQRLRVYGSAIPAFNSLANSSSGRKWIEVNLSTQTLTAWQGDVPVMVSTISSGKSATPTVTGRFQIGTKYTSQRMYGPGYDIPGVPWVMYFFADYAIHGAYWHNRFGTPTSHGCVNMRPTEAEALWNWAPAGTEVWVRY